MIRPFKILHQLRLSIAIFLIIPQAAYNQNTEKIVFNSSDSANDYYLAVPPLSGNIRGVQVLLFSYNSPEFILQETKLQNVAYGNDLLTIIASMKTALWADSSSVTRINLILKNVIGHFTADTSKFVLGGFMYSGNIALRYTELCYENPSAYPLLPKAVFAIDCPVDLLSLTEWCNREIQKNYFPGNVGDAKIILKALTDQLGTVSEHREKYIQLSPFYRDSKAMGNEQFLKHVPVRLYYDTDINWELKNRRNSYYDTYIPDGSEMVNRLLLAGNNEAEFVPSRLPGVRSNGTRNPHSWSIVDEVDCIHWIKEKLKIFNPQTYSPVYFLPVPNRWSTEVFSLPPDFAKQLSLRGVEDLRFFEGWGDPESEDHWSYAFLWWQEGNAEIDAAFLEGNLKTLFTGLIGRNIAQRKIPQEKTFPVEVKMHSIKTAPGDLKTFEGTSHMLNYITQTPMTLNLRIHYRDCSDKTHQSILFEISPKPFDHPNWQKLDQLNAEFKCVKP